MRKKYIILDAGLLSNNDEEVDWEEFFKQNRMANPTKTCRWILQPYSKGKDAVYCCKPCKFSFKKQDDGSRIKVYDSFCEKHKNK